MQTEFELKGEALRDGIPMTSQRGDAIYYIYRTIRRHPVVYPECRKCGYAAVHLRAGKDGDVHCPECGANLSKTGCLPSQSEFPLAITYGFNLIYFYGDRGSSLWSNRV
ncbi:hypothetical protein KS4_30730 [Poriferisphaera corsica]|uniref:Uncharacterized protein n=1 Tax=Poriferisphaera corsica TaxID=2528020 RepID=A0A517YXP9_9BACT|nr:hypothetical protein KS4_30730 [Poriferisphaera corsica]